MLLQNITYISHQLVDINLTSSTNEMAVRRQKLKYFGHVTSHNGLEKTIMQGMVAGKRSRGKPRQRWEKDITLRLVR